MRGTGHINACDRASLRGLRAWLHGLEHPRYEATAIYDAMFSGAREALELACRLPSLYLNNLLVVTDGENNSSTSDALVDEVRRFFPAQTLNLFVVGVGEAHVDSLADCADHVVSLAELDALHAALVGISDRQD